ncbi:MAG: citrate/2-methylcitrate synthase [Rhizomicrobium sp.]
MQRKTDLTRSTLFVDAETAASTLGVTVTTLYAYVGRKGIRTQSIPGSRQRRYWWPDIERLRAGHATPESLPATSGVKHETGITLMTQRGPYYRGRSALDLAKTHSLESIAALLWQVDEAVVVSAAAPELPKEFGRLQKLLQHASAVDRATALFPFIEHSNPRAFDLTRLGMARTGVDLLRWYTCLLANLPRPETRPIHETLARALGVGPELKEVIRCMLVLAADHGFEAGTYAVRACATAGVTPYRAILAGLAVVTGRRSTAGRSASINRLLDEISADSDPKRPILRRLKDGDEIPGFGSTIYENGDPRARLLMDQLEKIFGDDKGFIKLKKAISTVREFCDREPDFVLALAYGHRRLGVDGRNSLFPLGRSVGWIAHAIEQFETGESLRIPASYIGPLPT